MIRFVEVSKRFGGHQVLRNVTLRVARGTVHFVIGRSGAGKTVLIKQVVGLVRPDAGKIYFAGQDITELDESGFFAVRRRCQMIFQQATLFDAMTALENVAMPVAKRFGLPRVQARERGRHYLDKVGALKTADRLPVELGAGVRKRVAIARALALEPEVLLLDEPTTSLDPVAARRTDVLVREMTDALGLTCVVVSHDLVSLRTIADKATFMHEGCVQFEGSPAELVRSQDAAVGEFVHGVTKRWTPRRDDGASATPVAGKEDR